MKSILEIVYDVISESGEAINNNQEYNKLSAKASEIYTEFDKSMSGGQKEKLSELWNAEAGCEYEAGLAYFKHGFKTGLIVAFECLKD
ncbi:MAG: hypothetical protein K2J54_04720 [Clostridia bacterium]|nr:hypothetical protein [Clostridia bacterium]MDE7084875.1 hypothetical protein [Clostridia bacterium]